MGETAKHILIAAFPDIQIIDAAGPAEVFSQANREMPGAYEITITGWSRETPTTIPAPLATVPYDRVAGPVHTLLVPGGGRPSLEAAIANAAWMDWLRGHAPTAVRMASVCSGAFVLAALGVLDGRRATTHWDGLDTLAALYPSIRVDRNALYVTDGRVWTSAGITAGIDMALAMVARDLGVSVALTIARNMVVFLMRPGGQAQFSGALDLQGRAGPDLAGLPAWIEDRLHGEITVEAMADAMGLTVRTFHRHCTEQFGMTPGRLVTALRLERARALMAEPGRPQKAIAHACGFADPATFSAAFTKRFGVSPTDYRARFADNPV